MPAQPHLRLLDELDYEAVSLALGVEINLDIPTHVIANVLTARLNELSEDERAALPAFVVESIQKYLKDNQPVRLSVIPDVAPSTPPATIDEVGAPEGVEVEVEETQFSRLSENKIAYVLPPDYDGAPVSEILENFPRLDTWAKSGQVVVQMEGRTMTISGDCLGPWDNEKLLQIVESIVSP